MTVAAREALQRHAGLAAVSQWEKQHGQFTPEEMDEARLEFGALPLVPASVLAQASQSPQQAQLRSFLAGCTVVPLGENDAHSAGRLLAKTRTTDVVDAVLVTVALGNKAVILTGDPEGIERLVRASGQEAVVVKV